MEKLKMDDLATFLRVLKLLTAADVKVTDWHGDDVELCIRGHRLTWLRTLNAVEHMAAVLELRRVATVSDVYKEGA